MAEPSNPSDSFQFNKFTGLKNTVNRERMTPEELEVAVNVDIDNMGQLRRRRGFTSVSGGNFHSLFTSVDGTVYGVKNNALGIIRPNYTFISLRSGVGPEPISYVHVGDFVYFSSAVSSGKIDHATGTVYDWGAVDAENTWLSPVVNPVPDLPPIKGKLLGKPPLATSLAYWNGRIYLAQERTLWATELYLYDYVDKTKNFMMYETNITAIGAVTDGLYIGTEENIWFQSGPLNEMRRIPVNGGIIRGSLVTVLPHLLPSEIAGNSRSAIMMMTPNGLCAGFDNGMLYNLTQERFLFPDSTRVNGLFRMQDGVNQYIGVADSAGSPTSNARIGDYVDAEIRRFQGA
jgi:hypothetical protein